MTERFKRAPIGILRRQQKAALLFESKVWYLIVSVMQKAQSFAFTMMFSGFILLCWSAAQVIVNESLNLSLDPPYHAAVIGCVFLISGFLFWETIIFLSLGIWKDLREINTMLERLG